VKSASAKSGCATKTTGVETASTKAAAAAKPATAVEATAAAKAATTVAPASAATTASATAGQGNIRCKHSNRGSRDYGDDRFTQHHCAP
jgi:hypothetical protein